MKKYVMSFVVLFVLIGCKKEATVVENENSVESTEETVSLASWNEGKSKQAIIDFVTKTTTEGNPDFVRVEDRIACFDNDGTLWSEQPKGHLPKFIGINDRFLCVL